jgi:hypothetical protein
MPRYFLKIGGFLLSFLLLYLAFHKIDWQTMCASFEQTNYWILLAGALIGLLGFFMRAVDWKYLLAPVGNFSVWRLFPPVAIGYMANNLLPARIGEFVRAFMIGKREGVSKSSALATIFVERIIDGLTLLIILAVTSIFFEFPDWVKYGGFGVAGLFLTIAVLLALFVVKKQLVIQIIRKTAGRCLPGLTEKAIQRLELFSAGLAINEQPFKTFLAISVCLARWFFECCIYYFVMLSMGLHVPVYGILFVMVVVNIATLAPSAPAYVGPLQIGCIATLSVFDVEKSAAVAYSILLHASIFFPITIVGLAFFIREHLEISTLHRQMDVSV